MAKRHVRRLALPNYSCIDRATVYHEDLPVKLLLQRVTNDGNDDYLCLSWRTNLPSGANRQYYNDVRHGTGLWRIPVSVALHLLNQAHQQGMLHERHDDPYLRHGSAHTRTVDSRLLDAEEFERELAHLINHNRENRIPDWGQFPLFVVVEVPDTIRNITWRKIMMVDTDRKFCTFRSTTTDRFYRKGIADGMVSPWQLDNSMQDASSAVMREFRQVLLNP